MADDGISPENPDNSFYRSRETDNILRGHHESDPVMRTRSNLQMSDADRSMDLLSDERTLISRQWHYVMPLSTLCYVMLQAILNTQSKFCERNEPFAAWTFDVGIAVSACFGLSACYNFVNGLAVESWAQKETEHLRAVYAGAFTMSLIAGSSTVVYLTSLGQAVCRDALGMDTPNCQWPEWLVAAPLLVYIAIAVEDKKKLTVEDWLIIILMFLCILFGFVMNFFVDLAWGIILFILSSLCMVGNIILALKAKENTKNHESSKLLSRQWILERMRMKSKLAQLLFWLLPLFVFVYILGIVHVLDRDEVVVANMLIGLVVKLVFVSTLSLESVVMQFASERKVNERRRQFLRYVFHEVRVPLNTITMGITVLKDDAMVLDEASQEVVAMMDAAAGFMNNTLNDVLSMSKIEDGAISLVVKAFTLLSLLEGAMRAVRNLAGNKAVRIIVKGLSPRDEARNLTILGDENRLHLVLVNFLSNAIKFSVVGSVVTIEVGSALKCVSRKISEFSTGKFFKLRRNSESKRKRFSFHGKSSKIQQSPSRDNKSVRDCQIRYVTVLVNDLGAGIHEDDQGKLFQAFAQIRPHNLEGKGGRGSGLGLVMAKEIITLHGGEVLFKSELGCGSSFGFTIPFTVVDLGQPKHITPSVHHVSAHHISVPEFTHENRIQNRPDLGIIYTKPPQKRSNSIQDITDNGGYHQFPSIAYSSQFRESECTSFKQNTIGAELDLIPEPIQRGKDNDEYRRSNRIAHMIDDDSGDRRGVLGAGEDGGDVVKEVERRDVEGGGEKGGSGGEGKASASADVQVEVDVPQSGAVDSTVGDVFVGRNTILNGTSNKVPSCVTNGFPSGTDNGVRSGVVHGEMNAVVSGVVGGVVNGVVSGDTSGGASRNGSGGDSVTSPVPTAVGPLLRKRDSETGLILRARSISTDVSTRSQQNSFLNGDKGSERGRVGREMLSGSGRSSISLTSKSPLKGLSVGGTSRIVGDKETDRKMHFLLVDDAESNCKMLKMLLNKKGIKCDIAFNGLEAVTAFKAAFNHGGARRSTIYEVIFMDYTMPVMNGLEASSIIRALGFSGLIVGLTGNALDDDVANFIKAGADCVFSKPFREEHLSSLLKFVAEHGCESSDKSHSLIKPEQQKFYTPDNATRF